MSDRTTRLVIFGQIIFVISCLVCVLLNPAGLSSQSGLSFYGNFRATLVPYVLGFGLIVASLAQAAYALRDDDGFRARYLRAAFIISSVCLAGVMVTPSFGSPVVRSLHLLFGVTLFVTQAFVAAKLVGTMHEAHVERMLLGLQLVAIATVALSFRRAALLHMMIPAQIIAVLSFSGIVLKTTQRLAIKQIREQTEQRHELLRSARQSLTEDDEDDYVQAF